MVVRNQLPLFAGHFWQLKKKYSQLDKKRLDVMYGVKIFHQYLLLQTFWIVTDHKPLVSLFSPTMPILDSLATKNHRVVPVDEFI